MSKAGPLNARTQGLCCPTCGSRDSQVLDVRKGEGYVRRRHVCVARACANVQRTIRIAGRDRVVSGTRWTTYEVLSPRRGVICLPSDTRAVVRLGRYPDC